VRRQPVAVRASRRLDLPKSRLPATLRHRVASGLVLNDCEPSSALNPTTSARVSVSGDLPFGEGVLSGDSAPGGEACNRA
jgi:hypothetical protein